MSMFKLEYEYNNDWDSKIKVDIEDMDLAETAEILWVMSYVAFKKIIALHPLPDATKEQTISLWLESIAWTINLLNEDDKKWKTKWLLERIIS